MYKKVHPIIRIIIILLPLWMVWFYITQAGWYYMPDDYPKEMFIHSATHGEVDRDYQVLILGDSMANAAFLPELLSEETINLAITGGTCIESYYILKNYIKTHGAPRDVFFATRHDAYFDDSYITSHFFYHQFSLSEGIELATTLKQYDDMPELYDSYNTTEWFQDIFYLPSRYTPSLLNSSFYQRRELNQDMLSLVQLHRGNWLAIRLGSNITPEELTTLDHFQVSDFNNHYFDLLCKLCSDNGIRLHLMRTPYSSNFAYTEEYKAEYTNYFQSYADKYSGISVDVRFDSMDDLYFYDNGHLNLRGAMEFSNQMCKDYPDVFDQSLPVSANTVDALTADCKIETEEPYHSKWQKILEEKKARFERGE